MGAERTWGMNLPKRAYSFEIWKANSLVCPTTTTCASNMNVRLTM